MANKLSKTMAELDVIYEALSRYEWEAPEEVKEIVQSARKKVAQQIYYKKTKAISRANRRREDLKK